MRGTLKATLLVVPSLIAWAGAAFADPPAHAPAHGWRKKHDPGYVGYTGSTWERDYDVATGHCNREEIGAVVGGVAGGVIGSKVADRLCFVRSLYTEAINHDPAVTFFQTGAQLAGRPSMGAWLSYGLGSLNRDLPTFV